MLEIAESAAVALNDETLSVLAALRGQGVRIHLDDVGATCSSLRYLAGLPVDGIKIDRLLIQDIVADESQRVVVGAIMAIARGMHLEVVAEGVETDAQLRLLRTFPWCAPDRMSCDLLQGFLFARPLPAEELGERLRGGQAPMDGAPSPHP